ncbi:MAG: hypothetical protein ABIE74_00975 [Pseudomonadota bacterium]
MAVVVNSPIRKLPAGASPKEAYVDLIENPYISFILTGTRNHLAETLNYLSKE